MKAHTILGLINWYDYLTLLSELHTKLNDLVLQLLLVAFLDVHWVASPLMLVHDKGLVHKLHHYG
ncbi:hypothetical protein D3C76_1428420 [compost metagenome]